ncbi:MAG: acylneuraminate cytidylyltransferase family protein [Flavobacteriales bacterium]|nr:acylneuraminate cytidylyltransferase family protein [Flavobacteriales bacterium]
MTYKTVALLPMKANSERVVGKNFKNFAGKPLFKWVLEALLAVDEIEKVIINTDARHILADNGLVETDRIIIRDRPIEIQGDFVSMNRVIEDDIKNVASESYLMTHTTNPNISANTFAKAIEEYQKGLAAGFDSLFSVTKQQTRFYREDGSAVNHDPNVLLRTQDLEAWFEENSCLYVFSNKAFEQTNARIGKKPMLFETPRFESIDIDDAQSWKLAELVKKSLLNG